MKDVTRMQVRIPSDLAGWLKAKAAEENRSMNGQLIRALQEAKSREQEAA